MLRKMFSLGALVVVTVTFDVGNAAAKSDQPAKPSKADRLQTEGFSDGRYARFPGSDGFSDGRV
jgi:hypothetical protein